MPIVGNGGEALPRAIQPPSRSRPDSPLGGAGRVGGARSGGRRAGRTGGGWRLETGLHVSGGGNDKLAPFCLLVSRRKRALAQKIEFGGRAANGRCSVWTKGPTLWPTTEDLRCNRRSGVPAAAARRAGARRLCRSGGIDLGVMLATRGRAHHAVEHPQRNLKGQTCRFAGQAASRDRFIQYTVNRDDASGPRMPVVKNPLFAGNVGVQAPSCTTRSGRTVRWAIHPRHHRPSCPNGLIRPSLLMGYSRISPSQKPCQD